MNYHNRRHFTALLPCRCGLEPMRVYCDATDCYAVKCDCGHRTNGFTTIAGASHSWNAMNKKAAAPGVQDRRRRRKMRLRPLSGRK